MAGLQTRQQQCLPHHCHTCDQLHQHNTSSVPAISNQQCIPSHRLLFTLPWHHHPLHRLRKTTLLLALPSILCSSAPASLAYSANVFTANIVILLLSVLVCLVDLACYARHRAHDPDGEVEWPQNKIMIADALLAVALVYTFLCCLGWILGPIPWYETGMVVLGAWGALGGGICGILHAVTFWKELMARKKNAWLASLPQGACERCGYTSSTTSNTRAEAAAAGSGHVRPNVYPYAGPSADFRDANVLTPERSESGESAMEEGLLLGSDFEGGYQTISHPELQRETVLEQPEGVVVGQIKRGKGKKKAVKVEGA